MLSEVNYLVISDLHLTLALDDDDRATDEALVTFLRHYQRHRVEGRPWRLILAGDSFDFVYPDMRLFLERHPSADAPGERTDARWGIGEMAWRLEQTMREHAAFFSALADFLAAGNELALIKGNHDVELQWDVVRRRFRRTLERIAREERGSAPELQPEQISFHDWFYFEPGRLYVEHGNQYDEFNSWPDFLDPARVNDPEQAFAPLGSRMTLHLTNAFVDYKPGPTNGAFMRYIVSSGQLLSYKFIAGSLRVMAGAVARAGPFSEEGWQAGSAGEDRRLLRQRRSGLGLEQLQRIRRLQATPATAIRGFFINRMFLDRLFVVLFGALVLLLALGLGGLSAREPALFAAAVVALPVGALATLLRFKRRAWSPIFRWLAPLLLAACCVGAPAILGGGTVKGTFLVTLTCLVTSVSLLIMPLTPAIELGSHMTEVAAKVGELLDVPLVIFGHHHRCVDRAEEGRRYLNTGAWVNAGREGSYAHAVVVVGADGQVAAALQRGSSYLEASR